MKKISINFYSSKAVFVDGTNNPPFSARNHCSDFTGNPYVIVNIIVISSPSSYSFIQEYMEFEEAHNNLRAIRLLYALLHNNTLQLQYQFSEDLIERARGLLKSLLDVAVVSVFQTHLKIIATQENVPETSVDQENDVAKPQSDPPVAATNNAQSSPKSSILSRMTPHKDEESQKKLISEIEVKGSISDDGRTNNPIVSSLGEKIDLVNAKTTFPIEYSNSPRKESTLEQEHNNVNISSNVDESYRDKNSPLLSNVHEFQHNSSATGPDQKDDFCDDLLNAMKRIESRMFALQLCSNLASSPKNSADKQTMPEVRNLDRPHIDTVSAKRNDTPKEISSQLVSRAEELRSQGKIQPQKLAVTKRVKSETSEGDGLRIQLNQDDVTWKPSTGHRNCKSVVRKNPISWSEADQNQKKKSTEHSYRHLPVKSIVSSVARKQPQPHQMVIRPTLLDQRYNEIKVFSHKNRQGSDLVKRGSHKKRNQPQDNDDDDEEEEDDDEVEESSSNNYQSSSWTSQQVSTNGGGGGSSGGSEDYSLQGETEVSTSGTMVDASYEYSSEESNTNSYTSNENYNSLNSADSLKSDRYYSERKPEKKVGGLRRLKNKLGLIFHHHHHHHHYHHSNDDNDDDDDDDGSIHSKMRQRHSMWSNLQNVFHHKNKHHGVLTNGRGSAVARVSHRNHVGQFHRIVEGLMGHMRHKKEEKPHKAVVMKGSRNAPHGHRKNNPNWWKMLQQHRGVKVKKNRGRVRKKSTCQKSPKMLT
ncbi:hypothetical protein PIB30_064061 [Stylosanthes scabra]|uniref:Uncharacterized protein n=1 Tax=Stylosanthes scabra TaxID=79078 RepID=A0ABU6RMF8_9FABA|nr:hypothetical protein [Stylosanthes scabra]